MKPFIILFLFIGMFLTIHGFYDQKIKDIEKQKNIEYKFIPRTLYDEQLAENNLSFKVGHMFDSDSKDPWEKQFEHFASYTTV